MERAEHILAFDLATRTGIAWGSAIEMKPGSRAVTLVDPKSAFTWEFNVGALFVDMCNGQMPDVVVWEVPMTVEAWSRQPAGRKQNGESLLRQNILAGILCRECQRKGVVYREAPRQTVLKHFTGKASWSSAPKAGDGRKNGKIAVLKQCVNLGWLPPGCKDDDRGDALALFSWAATEYGGARPPEPLPTGPTLFNSEQEQDVG